METIKKHLVSVTLIFFAIALAVTLNSESYMPVFAAVILLFWKIEDSRNKNAHKEKVRDTGDFPTFRAAIRAFRNKKVFVPWLLILASCLIIFLVLYFLR